MSPERLRGIVDEATSLVSVGQGGFGSGHLTRDGRWFVKVPIGWGSMNRSRRAKARAKIEAEAETASALRAAGFRKFIEPTWSAESSSGAPALVSTGGEPLDSRDVEAALLGEVEEFLADVEEAGWRVRDDIQLVRGRRGVFLTDLGAWSRASSDGDPSELDERVREAAHWAVGDGDHPLVTLAELRGHAAWLRQMLSAGTLPSGQADVEREQWLGPLEERESMGLGVPRDLMDLVRSVAGGRLSAARHRNR